MSSDNSAVLAWTTLVLGGILDIVGSGFMTNANGFKNVKSTVAAYGLVILTTSLAIVSLDHIDLSIGWAIMAAVEVVGAAIAGIVIFKEPLTITKLVGLVITIAGVVFLSLTEGDGWRPWPSSWDTPLWTAGGENVSVTKESETTESESALDYEE